MSQQRITVTITRAADIYGAAADTHAFSVELFDEAQARDEFARLLGDARETEDALRRKAKRARDEAAA